LKLLENKRLFESTAHLQRSLQSLVTFAKLKGSGFEEIKNQHLQNVEGSFDQFEKGDDLGDLQIKLEEFPDRGAENEIRELANKEQKLLKAPTEGDVSVFASLGEEIQKLNELKESAAESGLRILIKEAIEVLESNDLQECPVCLEDDTFEQVAVLDKLRRRSKVLDLITKAEDSLIEKIKGAQLSQKISDWQIVDETFLDSRFKEEIKSARELVANLIAKASVDSEIKFAGALSELMAESADRLGRISRELAMHSQDIAVFKLVNNILIENKDRWIEVERILKELNREKVVFSKCQTALVSARDEVIDKIFQEIQEETEATYSKLNSGAQEFDKIDIRKLRKSSVQLGINFFGDTSVDPNSALSSGHLDLFGLAMYLTTIRRFYPPRTLIFLEDIINSNDNEHKQKIASFIVEELRDYQVIITTHLRSLFETFRHSIAFHDRSADWTTVEFGQWDMQTGANLSKQNGSSISPSNRMKFLTDNLTQEGYLNIGGVLRIVTEEFLKRVGIKKKTGVIYKDADSYTAGDFIRNEKLKNALAADLPNKGNTDDEKKVLEGFFSQPDVLNFLSHDKEWTDDVPLSEVKEFVLALQAMLLYEDKGVFKRVV